MAVIEFAANVRVGTCQEAPGQWVAWCPSLDLYTRAGSQRGVMGAIGEAMVLWFEDCVVRGTIDAALREVGYLPAQPDGEYHRTGFDHVEVGEARYERPIDYLEDNANAGGRTEQALKFHWELCRAGTPDSSSPGRRA